MHVPAADLPFPQGRPWPAEALWEAVVPALPGFSVEVLPQLDSTNSELMRRARAGQTEPVLLVAERQSAGRGRLGRVWQGSEDAGALPLSFSLGLSLQRADWSGLSLAVGVAVVEALRAVQPMPGLGLKWPNDLWCDAHKLAGILIETAGQGQPRYAVIGIGVNIVAPAGGADWSVPPIGLRALWPQADAPSCLLAIVPALVQAVQLFDREGFAPFQRRFNQLDLLRDQAVHWRDAQGRLAEGVAQGVDAQGLLRVANAEGLQTIGSGEVSVRPAHLALPPG